MKTSLFVSPILAATLFVSGCSNLAAYPLSVDPYDVQIIGESNEPLRQIRSDARIISLGTVGRRFMIQVTNQTESEVGVQIAIDGLDEATGLPVLTEGLRRSGGYFLKPHAILYLRGFRIGPDRLSTFRFASSEASFGAISGTKEFLGTIRVTFFSIKPGSPDTPETQRSSAVFVAQPLRQRGQATPLRVGDIVDAPPFSYADEEFDRGVGTLTLYYADVSTGLPLGTVPPPLIEQPVESESSAGSTQNDGRNHTTKAAQKPKAPPAKGPKKHFDNWK